MIISHTTVHFVFYYYHMLYQNGPDATRQIRKEGFQRLMIGLTGNALDDDVAVFFGAGIDCVIHKPLRIQQLDAILAHVASCGYASEPDKKYTAKALADGTCDFKIVDHNEL